MLRDGDLSWGRLRYGKLWVTDARGRVLPARLTASGHRIFLSFDAAGARYPIRVDPLVWIQQEVTSSDGAANDEFGLSVAISGTTALVGAPFHNASQGAAYVYTENGSGVWSQTAELIASDGAANDMFGSSVALSGMTAIMGAPDHKVGSNADQGAAYVYADTGSGWSQTTELTASDGAANDMFGSSVALSGAIALMGAPLRTVGGNTDQGAAYIFGNTDLNLTLNTPSTVSHGVDYTGQAILTNNGNSASPALSVILPVPGGTSYVTSSATQGSCNQVSGTVTCNLGSLAANGGSASSSITLEVTAPGGTVLSNHAGLALSTPVLSQGSTTTVTVPPAVTGLVNASVTVGQSVPAESFTIVGTGALTVSVASSNPTLVPHTGLDLSSGCDTNGASCTLAIIPVPGEVGTATVTVAVQDGYGQKGSESFVLTVKAKPPSSGGGSGGVGFLMLAWLGVAVVLRRRMRAGGDLQQG